MGTAGAFRLFGFPVHVRYGFIAFLVIVLIVNGGGRPGLWMAGCMAALTLVHELGHAFAARATGAEAEIALDFLFGYAAFTPTRRLSAWERAGISVAGPAAQIALSTAILLAIGGSLWPDNWSHHSAAEAALWWTGPVIGLLNLIPVLPFDGGNIVLAAVEAHSPVRGRLVMIYFSLALSAVLTIFVFLNPDFRPFVVFAALPLITQYHLLEAEHARATRIAVAAADARHSAAEEAAWLSGVADQFGPNQLPSPWFGAHTLLRAGRTDEARAVLVADLESPAPPRWWPPDGAPERDLERLVDLLPRPLPSGNSFSEYMLANILLRLGEYDDAARYAAGGYERHQAPVFAVCVSRAAAALGDRSTALAWLRASTRHGAASEVVRYSVQTAPEFAVLRDDPEFAGALPQASPHYDS